MTVNDAKRIAYALHSGQRTQYDNTPYIEHVERVAAQVSTNEEKQVAYLHDVVEDTPWTLSMLRMEGFSDAVVDAVGLLTRDGDFRDYWVYLDRLITSANPLALTVKRADLLDNLRPSCPPRLRARYTLALRLLSLPAV